MNTFPSFTETVEFKKFTFSTMLQPMAPAGEYDS